MLIAGNRFSSDQENLTTVHQGMFFAMPIKWVNIVRLAPQIDEPKVTLLKFSDRQQLPCEPGSKDARVGTDVHPWPEQHPSDVG